MRLMDEAYLRAGAVKAMQAGGPGSGRHSGGAGQNILHDPHDPAAASFAREYAKTVKNGDTGNSDKITHIPGGKSGFGGSGTSFYEHGGNKFQVDRNANGKGFYGTDHHVSNLGNVSNLTSKPTAGV